MRLAGTFSPVTGHVSGARIGITEICGRPSARTARTMATLPQKRPGAARAVIERDREDTFRQVFD